MHAVAGFRAWACMDMDAVVRGWQPGGAQVHNIQAEDGAQHACMQRVGHNMLQADNMQAGRGWGTTCIQAAGGRQGCQS